MSNFETKRISKAILKGSVGKSDFIIFMTILNIAAFSFLQIFAEWLTEGLGSEIKSSVRIGIYSAIIFLNLLSISVYASSLKAWFFHYRNKNRAGCTLFWFRPKRAFRCFRIYTLLFLKKLTWAIAFILPGGFLIVCSALLAMSGGIELNLFLCGVIGGAVMLIPGAIFYLIMTQKYFLVTYIAVSDPRLKCRDIFKKSREKMNGKLRSTLRFKLSFAPWMLLSLSVIPGFYAVPYYCQSLAVRAKECLKS